MSVERRFALIGHTHTDLAGLLPVGSVFFTISNTNPATLLGYGTWVLRASGQPLVGA